MPQLANILNPLMLTYIKYDMNKSILLIVVALSLFIACQSNPTTPDIKDTTGIDANHTALTTQSCYTYIKNKDTASLTLITSGQIATGELSYQWFEKDKNKGDVRGEMRGDTLVADYTFMSEGKESVRQVVFLKSKDKLIEGFGETLEKDGKTVFKDLSKLTFSQTIEFNKTDCK